MCACICVFICAYVCVCVWAYVWSTYVCVCVEVRKPHGSQFSFYRVGPGIKLMLSNWAGSAFTFGTS